MSIQINSTIAKHNVAELPALLDLALSLGADALHIFMLVPVGCGVSIADREMLPADEYERVLHWFYDRSKDVLDRPEGDLRAALLPGSRAADRGGAASRATAARRSSRTARGCTRRPTRPAAGRSRR